MTRMFCVVFPSFLRMFSVPTRVGTEVLLTNCARCAIREPQLPRAVTGFGADTTKQGKMTERSDLRP
jgi:hypothetical protein